MTNIDFFIEIFKSKGYENNRWLNRYIKFVLRFKLDIQINKTQKHHILPKSLFPEYSDLTTNKWNESILPIRAHIITHYMLAKSIGGKM